MDVMTEVDDAEMCRLQLRRVILQDLMYETVRCFSTTPKRRREREEKGGMDGGGEGREGGEGGGGRSAA